MRLLAALLLAGCATAGRYPESRRTGDFDELHGTRVPDPYRWLEDSSRPEVKSWMAAQDARARAALLPLARRAALAARLKELLYLDTISRPLPRGGRLFWTRRVATKEKAIVEFRDRSGGEPKVLFDPNTWSQDGGLSLGGWSPSWDGKKVAYNVRPNNSDEATLHLIDVDTMVESKVDVIPGTKYGGFSWTPAGDGFYYTWLPTDAKVPVAERPAYAEVRFHKVGDDPKNDRIVKERIGLATKFHGASLSKDGRWLQYVVSHGWTSNDVWLRDLAAGDGAPWVPVVVGRQAHYEVDVVGGRLYVFTDEGAPRGRVFTADASSPAREGWKEIVPQHERDVLEGSNIVGGKLALKYLRDVATRLELRELDGRLLRVQPLPAPGTASILVGDEDDDEAYFTFHSFLFLPEIHRTSVKSGETSVYFKLKAPIDPSQYEVEQRFYPSKDGTRVPIWIVARKGIVRDGKAPLMLTGYGGFKVNMAPSFSASLYAWLEQGGIFAQANLRGGGEYGEEWHKAGMLTKKQNVFDDFIAAAEFLISEKYTRPGKLTIRGGSNGGLLVGAALAQRPELFGAVLCAVPLLDMVRYQKSQSGKTWTSEYGSIDDAEQFKALYAYSPYHHVKDGARYPPVLFISADTDDRVDPMHARKMAAALQRAGGGPFLLRIEMQAGHGGADAVKQMVEALADQYAFALAHTEGP